MSVGIFVCMLPTKSGRALAVVITVLNAYSGFALVAEGEIQVGRRFYATADTLTQASCSIIRS